MRSPISFALPSLQIKLPRMVTQFFDDTSLFGMAFFYNLLPVTGVHGLVYNRVEGEVTNALENSCGSFAGDNGLMTFTLPFPMI